MAHNHFSEKTLAEKQAYLGADPDEAESGDDAGRAIV